MDGVVAYTVVLARLISRDVHTGLLVSVVALSIVSDSPLDAAAHVGAVRVLLGVLCTPWDFLQKPIAESGSISFGPTFSPESFVVSPSSLAGEEYSSRVSYAQLLLEKWFFRKTS